MMQLATGRTIARWMLAVFYFTAGVLHLYLADAFVQIVPDFVPYPWHVVIVTGLCEIVGAIAILTKSLRYAAIIAFALYAMCVWPANIKHAMENIPIGHIQLGWWYHAPRLAFQPVLIWWALFAGEIVTWPFAGRRKTRPVTGNHK